MAVKLLIIDDEEFIRLPIQDYFEDCGWTVFTFNNGEDALKYLEKENADCVIADMRLHGMTGIEFIIKANLLRPGIRYVIYSGAIDSSIAYELNKAGIFNYAIVIKPAFDLDELRIALEAKSKGA